MKILVEKSRYISLVVVISLLLTFVMSIFWGLSRAIIAWMEIILSLGQASEIILLILKLIDAFLIAIVLYILAASIYKLFVGELELPSALVARNLSELKTKLSSLIVLVMAVHFVEVLFMDGMSGLEKMWYAVATALVAGALIAFSRFGVTKG